MKIGLTYNLKSDCPSKIQSNEDASAEFESAETVEDIVLALTSLGHTVISLPYNPALPKILSEVNVDIVFNIAEGWWGRNREALVPALLEFYEIPYTGSDPLTLGLCLDKALCKKIAEDAGIAAAWGITADGFNSIRADELKYPVFVKPNAEGSSKGIRSWSLVCDRNELEISLEWVLRNYGQCALIEEFLPGREFTIAVIGNKTPTTLPIMEILPGEKCAKTNGFIYSFETKSSNLEQLLCPAPIDEYLQNRLLDMALRVFQALNCRDVARIDFRLDRSGNPRFLEVNPLPGLSRVSLLTLQAQAAGMTFDDLLAAILSAALERYPELSMGNHAKEAALG
mgnify:FL=1